MNLSSSQAVCPTTNNSPPPLRHAMRYRRLQAPDIDLLPPLPARSSSSPAPRAASGARWRRRWPRRAGMSCSTGATRRRSIPPPVDPACRRRPSRSRRSTSPTRSRSNRPSPRSSGDRRHLVDVAVAMPAFSTAGRCSTSRRRIGSASSTPNPTACFRLAREAARPMIERRQGRIILTASMMGPAIARPTVAAYVAAKGGLVAPLTALAVELGPHGITSNAIAPGFCDGDEYGPHRQSRILRIRRQADAASAAGAATRRSAASPSSPCLGGVVLCQRPRPLRRWRA